MSTVHAQFITDELNKGASQPATLFDWGLNPVAVLAIPPRFVAKPQSEYCPFSDIPDWVDNSGQGMVGVHFNGSPATCSDCWVIIDNGMCAAGFWFVAQE